MIKNLNYNGLKSIVDRYIPNTKGQGGIWKYVIGAIVLMIGLYIIFLIAGRSSKTAEEAFKLFP